MSGSTRRKAFRLGQLEVAPGTRQRINLPVASLYSQAPLELSVDVVHGRKAGPVLLVCGAIHGDEINGVEIIRRLLKTAAVKRLRGTLMAVPIVNVFGFIQLTRYLPDRRDLNRCFPGSEKGSLAGRLAWFFRTQVVDLATHVIDLHTGAIHRFNLPQIRAKLDDPETARIANAFGAPVVLNSELRDGSLRAYVETRQVPAITYEGGEALRFDEVSIVSGVHGILRVMRELEMLPRERSSGRPRAASEVARSSSWVRAHRDGILRPMVRIGHRVSRGQVLGKIGDAFGDATELTAPFSGIVIGLNNLPLVNEGDAVLHVARFEEIEDAVKAMDEFRSGFDENGGDPFRESPLRDDEQG